MGGAYQGRLTRRAPGKMHQLAIEPALPELGPGTPPWQANVLAAQTP